MSIQFIGAGFLRTGTTILKSALQTLGFNDIYHFKYFIVNSDKLKYLNELNKDVITGQTAETTVAEDDLVLVTETSASAALKRSSLIANNSWRVFAAR